MIDGSCLKQEKVTFTHKKVSNIYIAYEINLQLFIHGRNFALENSLFGTSGTTAKADLDKCKYSGSGIEFDARGSLSYLIVMTLVKTW